MDNQNEASMLPEKKAVKTYKPGSLAYVWNYLIHTPTALIGMITVAALLIISFLTPYIFSEPITGYNMANRFLPSSLAHPFGCDDIGRDIFVRVLYGAKYTIGIGIFATTAGILIGIILGSIAGYFGGVVDTVIMRVLDVFQSFPSLLLAITLAAALGPGFWKVVLACALSGAPNYSRMVRANILTIRGMEYIEAAKSINCSTPRIIFSHALPNAMSPIIVDYAMGIAAAGLAAASLSFLGLGVQQPTPEWGSMLSASRSFVTTAPHMILWPGIFIVISVISFNLIGDAARDALDPKLRV